MKSSKHALSYHGFLEISDGQYCSCKVQNAKIYSTVYVPKCFWLVFCGWGFFLTELSRKCLGCQSQSISLSKQQGAGEHHETISFISLGTNTVSSSAPPSALVRRDCCGHPDFTVSPGLTLKKQNTAQYLSLSSPTGCLGTFSSHPLVHVVHQRRAQAASVFCLLTQAP